VPRQPPTTFGPQGAQGATGAAAYDFGLYEARPLAASAVYSDLHLWSWTDENFPGTEGQTASTDLTLEFYRDTTQIKAFLRHDQDNAVSIDYQMPHEWAQTPVYLHLHLIGMAAVGGNAYFTAQYFFGNDAEVLPALAGWTSIAPVAFPIAGADQYRRQICGLGLIPPPAIPTVSSILSVKFVRAGDNLLDTYSTNKPTPPGTGTANLCLESYDIHYQRLLVGSEEQYSGLVPANPARLFFDPAWSLGNVYLQVVVKSDLGNACSFQLYDVTGAAAVAGSTVTVSSASYAMVEVGPLALGAGTRDYIIQGKYDAAADEPKLAWARFVVR